MLRQGRMRIAEGTAHKLCWNAEAFQVAYPSLAPHLCVGGVYVRLLLDGVDQVSLQPAPLHILLVPTPLHPLAPIPAQALCPCHPFLPPQAFTVSPPSPRPHTHLHTGDLQSTGLTHRHMSSVGDLLMLTVTQWVFSQVVTCCW